MPSPKREYNMRIFKKTDEYGKISLYLEDQGKVWRLKGGDFSGQLTEEYKLLIDTEENSDNFYS